MELKQTKPEKNLFGRDSIFTLFLFTYFFFFKFQVMNFMACKFKHFCIFSTLYQQLSHLKLIEFNECKPICCCCCCGWMYNVVVAQFFNLQTVDQFPLFFWFCACCDCESSPAKYTLNCLNYTYRKYETMMLHWHHISGQAKNRHKTWLILSHNSILGTVWYMCVHTISSTKSTHRIFHLTHIFQCSVLSQTLKWNIIRNLLFRWDCQELNWLFSFTTVLPNFYYSSTVFLLFG